MTQLATIHLPPPGLRLCGHEYRDDDYFVRSAVSEVERLVERGMLSRDSRVLEVGCGPGRFAIGIIHALGSVRSYTGVDVKANAVEWCQKNIAAEHPAFEFVHVDVRHARYNTGGALFQRDVPLPAADGVADLVYLYSVFSHAPEHQVDALLEDFSRVLAPGGHADLTGFFESGVEPVAENPAGYLRDSWNGGLHCVRYECSFFEEKIRGAGLAVERFEHRVTPSGQSRYTLCRREDVT